MSVAVSSVFYFLGAAPVYLVTGILLLLKLLYSNLDIATRNPWPMFLMLVQPDLTFKLNWWIPDR
jgi:hypothetical protein